MRPNVTGANPTNGYDALNRLASRTLGSGRTAVVTNYLYDGVQLLGEYSSTGALVRRYIPGATLDEPLVIFDGTNAATKTWLYGDERGSITAAANAAGTLLTAYSYGPFGEPNATAGVSLRYTGQMLDGSSGLYYYRARWYSPYMGRFLSPDPIGLEGGTHFYRFVENDPIDFVDPLGLEHEDNCAGYGNSLSKVGGVASLLGEGATYAGLAATATVVGAEAGVPLAIAGKITQGAGGVLQTVGALCQGKYASAAGNIVGALVGNRVSGAVSSVASGPLANPITKKFIFDRSSGAPRFIPNPWSGKFKAAKAEATGNIADRIVSGIASVFDGN